MFVSWEKKVCFVCMSVFLVFYDMLPSDHIKIFIKYFKTL